MKTKILLNITITILLSSVLLGFSILMIPVINTQISEISGFKDSYLFYVSSYVILGLLIGIFFISHFADKYGRRKVLLMSLRLLLVLLLVNNIFRNFWMFLFFRFIIWIFIGAISIIIPLLVAEISTAKIRGSIILFNQASTIFIIFITIIFSQNYYIKYDEISFITIWLEYFLIFILCLFIYKIPESPLWQIMNNREVDALKDFKNIGFKNPHTKFKLINKYLRFFEKNQKVKLFSIYNYKSIKIVLLLIIFYHLSGIGVILFYTPLILEISDIQQNSFLFTFCFISSTHLLLTLTSIFLIDTIGRRTLLMIGSVGMAFFLAMLSKAFFTENFTEFAGLGIIIYVLGFIVFFSFSIGSTIWVIISEIFPFKLRAKGQAFGSIFYLVMLILSEILIHKLIIQPTIIAGGPLFTFFGIIMIILFFYAWKNVPITERKTLEGIQIQLKKE